MRKKRKELVTVIITSMMLLMSMSVVKGEDSLDGVGVYGESYIEGGYTSGVSEVDRSNKESADAVGDLFQGAGITNESAGTANQFLYPIAKGINTVVSFILGGTSLAILLITALDLLCIAFPPVRVALMGGETRWVSDEAIACLGGVSEGKGGSQQMGGQPMGGSKEEKGKKGIITSYLKKRTVFLVVFAITTILFTSTVFTDLGIKIGMLVLSWITGMTGSIPA